MKLMLLPQSDKIQEFTKKKISLEKFSPPECLLGLVTADALRLTIIVDHIVQFINNNPGRVLLKKSREELGRIVNDHPSQQRPNQIYEKIKTMDEETQKRIFKSLDTSSYTKKELLDLVRNKIEEVERAHSTGASLLLFKDDIECTSGKQGFVFFIPQHKSKME